MPKSLVTGGAGFIGSNLVDMLIDLGHDVIVIDNESADNKEFYWNEKAENYKLDICDYDSIKNLFNGVDYVFHLAAESRLQNSIANPIETAYKNFVGTCIVLQCAKEANVKKLMYSSTSSAYGLNPPPNSEEDERNCLNPYATTKVAAEDLCTLYTKLYGLKTIIFRYFNVYGERSPVTGQYSLVLGIFLDQASRNEPLTIVGDGSQRRDFIHVKDVAYANIIATQKDIPDEYYGTVFNVGSGENISILEIANIISNNHVYLPERAGEAKTTLANINKIKNMFGWEPNVHIKKWIETKI